MTATDDFASSAGAQLRPTENYAPTSTVRDDFASMGGARDQNLQNRMEKIKMAAPLFAATPEGIQAAMAFAQSGMSDDDMVKAAKSQAAMMMSDAIKSQIDKEDDPAKKWALWQQLTDSQKKTLTNSGYTAPPQAMPEEDTSPLGITKHVLGGLVHDVTQNPVTKPVLELAGKGLSQVQHLARVGILGTEEEGFLGIGGTISPEEYQARRGSLSSMYHDILDLWDRTGDGEKTFSAKASDRAEQAMAGDDNKYRFVQSMAAGEDVATFLTDTMKMDPNDPNFQDEALRYNQYLADQKVQDTITDLKNNKISLGRVAASRVFKRGTTSYNILSGALDATVDVIGDPVFWATEGLGEFRYAARAIDSGLAAEDVAKNTGYIGRRIDYLVQNVPKFNSAMDQIATRLSEGKAAQLMDEMPSVRKGINSMSEYFTKNHMPFETLTREDVVNYFKDTARSGDLFNGNWSVAHFEGTSLPSFGRMQEFKSGVIAGVKESIDQFRLADYGLDGMTKEQLSDVFQSMGMNRRWATLAQAQNGVGEFLKSLVTKVPTRNYMNPFDDKAPQDFRAMMDYVLPKHMQEPYVDQFLRAGNIEGRRAVYSAAVDAMWQYSGASTTQYGSELFRKITQNDQVYMGMGMDRLNGVPRGVLENDVAHAWAIPNFPDMLKATKDVTFARRLLDETNDGLISKFMNYWRPAVLVRIGFIPRSYGEEMLTFIHREGLASYVRSQAALAAVKPEEAWFLKPTKWIADSMVKHVPYTGDAWSATASHLVNYADAYFKNFAGKLAGDQLVEAARKIVRNNEMLNALGREIGSYHGMAAEGLGERARRETIYQKDANGDIVPANITFGQIASHMRGDAFYHHTVYREMMRVADSELARPVMDAMRRSMGLEEGTTLHNLLKDTGFLPTLEPHIPMVPEGPLMHGGMTQEEFVARTAKPYKEMSPGTVTAIHPEDNVYTGPHPNVRVVHDMTLEESHYQLVHPETGEVQAHIRVDHDTDAGTPSLRAHALPGQEDKADELMRAMHEEGAGAESMIGFDQTKYGAENTFRKRAAPQMVPGEPIPRDDLTYGHALLRARQQIPNQVMPKFEWYLKHPTSVSQKSVISELTEAGMDESQAWILVHEVIPNMTTRQAQAIFTQDGVLERNLQARMIDPNQEFDVSNVPGFTSERYYHGSYQLPEDGKLKPIHYREGNLYGPGFYTTEDPGVAGTYTGKNWGVAGEPREGLFQLGWQGNKPPNLIDLDKPPTPEVKKVIESHFGPQDWEYGENQPVRPDWIYGDEPPPTERTLGEIIESLAGDYNPEFKAPHLAEGRAEAYIKDLLGQGYDGYTHIGGGRMGDKAHKVSIFFDTDRLGVLKAPGVDSVASFLPSVRSTLADVARKEYEDHLLELWSEGGSTHNVGSRLATGRLANGDMSQYTSLMARGSEVQGDVVASAPARGTRRVYTVVAPPETLSLPGPQLRFSPLGKIFDHEEGWVPISTADTTRPLTRTEFAKELREMELKTSSAEKFSDPSTWTAEEKAAYDSGDWKTFSKLRGYTDEEMADFNRWLELAGDGKGFNYKFLDENHVDPDDVYAQHVASGTVPSLRVGPSNRDAWFSTDHNEATELHQRLLRYKPNSNLRVAYTDIPEDVFRQGQSTARSAGAAGLDPLAQARQSNSVWLPKDWRKDYQALGDDYQLLEPEVANGHVRLYRIHEGDGTAWTGDRNVAENSLPFEKNNVDYADVPARTAEQWRSDVPGRFNVPEDQVKAQELKTELGTGVASSKALADWGVSVSQKVHQVFGGGSEFDETIQNIIHNALNDDLRLDHLWDLKTTQLPEETIGPQILVAQKDNWLKGMFRWGFDHVTQAGDAVIRSPMFLHNYAKNLPDIRTLVEHSLGDEQANHVIGLIADHLGVSRGAAISAWYSLPEDIRGAVNPMEAAIARDHIPPVLRQVESHADLRKLGEAADAIYHNKDPELVEQLREEIRKKKQGIRGVFPSIAESDDMPNLDSLVESYLNLPEKVRTNIYQNGLPDVFPKELMGKEMPLNADQWSAFRDAIDKNKFVEDTIHKIATTRAVNDTIPWVHNHHLRSQFQEHAKHFIPFWFAQENFIGRAANLMARDPAVVRQAQMAVHGLQSFGAISQNQFGEDVFNIPFTGALMRTLSKGAEIFGKYTIPMYDDFSGQVKYTLPGIDELTNIAPSFSPVAALPVQGLAGIIPELKPLSNFISGERGQDKLGWDSLLKQIMPSYAYNIYKGITVEHPEGDITMMSSMIQTAQRMEAAGMGIPEKDAGSLDVPSDAMQEYLDRLANHTRLATIVKGIVGFVSPVSPSIDPVEQFSPEFQKLLRTMPLDDALTVFLKQHPDGAPYTVMKTRVPSGAPLPSSPEALAMMESQPEFFSKYPNTAAWFLPQAAVEDQFAADAYNQQLAMNLRVKKSPKDWYRDYYFAAAAPDYFATKEGYDKRFLAAKGNAELRQQLTDQYQTWKQQYFSQHPVFAEEIQSPEGQQRRQRIMNEMLKTLDDPVAAATPQAEDMGTLLKTYLGTKDRLGQLPRQDKASIQTRQAIKDQFMAWAPNYVMDHPMINAFWQRVIQPEIDGW